ncbi:MAG TPA: patatin-like phospholipase family protein [Sphingomicrobium sp.]|nr:patatin-like phospholipase family protein [Sphingomicrobium sp.]
MNPFDRLWREVKEASKRLRGKGNDGRTTGIRAEAPGLPEQVPPDDTVAGLVQRRRKARLWWETGSEPPPGLVGLALSGGGIRSATFSLGLIQALARSDRGAFARVDIVSTVSGGGYVGCFLRSLFMPDSAKGIAPKIGKSEFESGEITLDQDELSRQYDFATRALASGPDERDIKGPTGEKQRNPLWWLREHSRYLAPNGPTDYAIALAYVARNWVAMLYIFLLASFALFTALVLVKATAGLWPVTAGIALMRPWSPVFWLALIPLAIISIHAVAYWITQAMSPNEPDAKRQWQNLLGPMAGTYLAAAIIFLIAAKFMRGAFPPYSALTDFREPTAFFVRALALALILMVIGVSVAVAVARSIGKRPSLTSELRRKLTRGLTNWSLGLIIILAVALVDSAGAWLVMKVSSDKGPGIKTAALLPLLAYLIKKLPEWFGSPTGEKGKVAALFSRFLNVIALIAGIVLFGILAVAADALSHAVAWAGTDWNNLLWNDTHWNRLLVFVAVIWVLTLLSGWADGFINLSSLHSLYSARLTRAYLGATNNARLRDAVKGESGITESHPDDYIQPQIYCRADLPAPLHLINATINETIDPQSQLVSRDRKGDVLTLEPQGIRVANKPVAWSQVGKTECAEQLSLGQWCSISGAAASSGMGRLTNLGFALAFTFANVRLGYWWWSPGACTERSAAGPFMRLLSEHFGTFVYLFNEMTARYSRGYDRKYITDGGHFENSGAYRLIQRRVPLILVTDNGADPKYRFADLENLVRLVRLDLGGETEILAGDRLESFRKDLGAPQSRLFVDPHDWDDWRDAFSSSKVPGFALVLRMSFADGIVNLIWLKPRTQPGMPADLVGYGGANPLFPQQPTGDQFFDEAQWESYRRLGELTMTRLLDGCPRLLM